MPVIWVADTRQRRRKIDIFFASHKALRENPETRVVTMEHFFRAVKEEIPSVTDEMVKEYEKLARKVKQESVRIGFKRGE